MLVKYTICFCPVVGLLAESGLSRNVKNLQNNWPQDPHLIYSSYPLMFCVLCFFEGSIAKKLYCLFIWKQIIKYKYLCLVSIYVFLTDVAPETHEWKRSAKLMLGSVIWNIIFIHQHALSSACPYKPPALTAHLLIQKVLISLVYQQHLLLAVNGNNHISHWWNSTKWFTS